MPQHDGMPTLQLDPVYSPPAEIPTDPANMIYNAPKMDHMLKPIKVKILNSNKEPVMDPVMVTVTTVPSRGWKKLTTRLMVTLVRSASTQGGAVDLEGVTIDSTTVLR